MSGKGDRPRNCFTKEFRDNHDHIDWSKKYWYIAEYPRPIGTNPIPKYMSENDVKRQIELNRENPCPPTFHTFNSEKDALAFVQHIKLPSSEWQRLIPDPFVMDPDGWDRKNFEASWNERITREEYERRVIYSTCQFGPDFFKKYIDK